MTSVRAALVLVLGAVLVTLYVTGPKYETHRHSKQAGKAGFVYESCVPLHSEHPGMSLWSVKTCNWWKGDLTVSSNVYGPKHEIWSTRAGVQRFLNRKHPPNWYVYYNAPVFRRVARYDDRHIERWTTTDEAAAWKRVWKAVVG